MSAYTKEPWRQGVLQMTTQVKRWSEAQCDEAQEREQRTLFARGQPVAQFRQAADARRAAACVDICAGIGTEELERHSDLMSAQLANEYTLREQRDELLGALENLVKAATVHGAEDTQFGAISLQAANDVIAKVKGGQQ